MLTPLRSKVRPERAGTSKAPILFFGGLRLNPAFLDSR